jgi:uncharacterized membrane protein YqjE
MVDQATTMNVNHNGRGKPAGVGRSVSGLAHDVITLAELQAQLLAVDLRDSRSRAALPVALLISGVLLALGTVPVLLLGIGWLLVMHAGWTEGTAFLTVGGSAIVLAAAITWIGSQRLRSAITVLTRSCQELSENIQWLKQTLKRPPGHHRTKADAGVR